MKVYVIILCLLLSFTVFSPPSWAAAIRADGVAYGPLNPKPPFNCGRGKPYCLPPKNPAPPKERCPSYKRHCGETKP
ncbi:hypothetical protein K2173_023169 [Erythroxylum novogranatense]|uniref:Rapid ALkalinization Factor n=1 Tax=Erythroxylum novogranatense TaxID=1862640 RepID=A0AAV8UB24_9ROSI|nr:hypothetical protein K2173_023169 [Erythroxylum novogranatense]